MKRRGYWGLVAAKGGHATASCLNGEVGKVSCTRFYILFS